MSGQPFCDPYTNLHNLIPPLHCTTQYVLSQFMTQKGLTKICFAIKAYKETCRWVRKSPYLLRELAFISSSNSFINSSNKYTCKVNKHETLKCPCKWYLYSSIIFT